MQWTDEEVRYLIEHYDDPKTSIKEIAVYLGRKPHSVYRKLKALKLGIYRPWTEKELDYLREKVDQHVAVANIAKQLFRSVPSVYNKIRDLGLSVKDPYEQSIAELARTIDVPYSIIYAAVTQNKVEYERNKSMNRTYVVDEDSLREYLIVKFPHRDMKCLVCSQTVKGDVFCEHHLPSHLRRRPKPPKRMEVNLSREDFQHRISDVLREMRERRGKQKQDLSRELNQEESWYGKFEAGGSRTIPMRSLLAICDNLNIAVKVVFEDKEYESV